MFTLYQYHTNYCFFQHRLGLCECEQSIFKKSLQLLITTSSTLLPHTGDKKGLSSSPIVIVLSAPSLSLSLYIGGTPIMVDGPKR